MEENEKIKQPKWLRRLEKESWQAELIISGLALFGTFQLPTIANWLINLLIRNLPKDQYLLGYVISYGALAGASFLTTFFLIHLVLRAYWIGLIGLNSVFPKGYDLNSGYFSPIYTAKLIRLLPKVSDSIKKVDEICSTLFSAAFVFLMMFSVFSFAAAIYLVAYNFLLSYISAKVLIYFVYALVGYYVLYSTIGMLSTIKSLKNNEWFQDLYFKLSIGYNALTFNIFFKPINMLITTFYSNYKKGKSHWILPVAFFVIGMALTMQNMLSSNVPFMLGKYLFAEDIPLLQKNKIYTFNYENQLKKEVEIIYPTISSPQIEGAFLKVFIPVFNNEEVIQEGICEPYQEDSTKSEDLNRYLKKEQILFCYQKYHQVFVNDSLYQINEFMKHEHPNNEEFGIIGYLPTNHFKFGKNNLRIVKLKNKEGEVYDEFNIPFWFSK